MKPKVRKESMKSKSELLNYVKKVALEHWVDEKEIADAFKSTVGIAYYIAKVAHDGAERENGTPYFGHPFRIYQKYGETLCINDINFDSDECMEYGIPFYGVQEVCLLHDVMEDWMATIEDIEGMYEDLGYKDYFEMYIKTPLQYITHDKDVDYTTYIDVVLKNPISALVKLLDLNDNIDIFGLKKYSDFEHQRMQRYVEYRKMINDKYHFIENINRYLNDCIYPYDGFMIRD